MTRSKKDKNHDSQGSDAGRLKPTSLAPLDPDEALKAALQVKREDVNKLDEKGKAKKKQAKRKKKD